MAAVMVIAGVVSVPRSSEAATSYTETPIGTLGGATTQVTAVSSTGIVVGGSRDSTGRLRAFRWTRAGGTVEVGPAPRTPTETVESFATSVSDGGAIGGTVTFTDGTTRQTSVFRRVPGRPLELTDLPYRTDGLFGISDDGLMVFPTRTGFMFDFSSPAFAWLPDGSVVTAFPTLGDLLGVRSVTAGGLVVVGAPFISPNVQVWRPGSAPATVLQGQRALGVGRTAVVSTGGQRWTEGGGVEAMPLLPGGAFAIRATMSPDGTVTGLQTVAGASRVVRWSPAASTVTDLGPLSAVDAAPTAQPIAANDRGETLFSAPGPTTGNESRFVLVGPDLTPLLTVIGSQAWLDQAGNVVVQRGTAASVWSPAADNEAPTVSVTSPPDGSSYDLAQAVNVAYTCTDNVAVTSCAGDRPSGGRLDTSAPGAATFAVTGADAAANTTTVTRSYTVTNDVAAGLGFTGSITANPNGLTVSVVDAPDPADGVEVTVGPGTGDVTLRACGAFTVRIAAGSRVTLTCGSVIVRVAAGSATVVLAPTSAVTLGAGGHAEIETGPGDVWTVTARPGSVPVAVSSDGQAWNVGPGDPPRVVDGVAPTIVADVAPASNAAGWHRSAVTVTYTCGDTGSGIASCTAPVTVSTDGAPQQRIGEAIDRAGLSARATATLSIDRAAPIVSVVGPVEGATYRRAVAPAPSCTTTDALSGVQRAATLAAPVSTGVGAVSATCGGALDVAGNTGSATVSYRIITDRQALSDLATAIAGLPLTGSDARRARKAVDDLRDAVRRPGAWTADGAPAPRRGKQIFDDLRRAADALGSIARPLTQDAAATIVAISRGWAAEAIATAPSRGVAARDIAAAGLRLQDGDRDAAAGEPGDAVAAYRRAWNRVTDPEDPDS